MKFLSKRRAAVATRDLLHRLSAQPLIDVVHNNGRSRSAEAQRDSPSNAVPSARDKRYLILNVHVRRSRPTPA